MKILFWNPNCGSGIEQIGYVYALMLKKLGHTVDLRITQCIEEQKEMSKTVNQYDCIILNEPHKEIFNRLQLHDKNNVYAIAHGSIENIPLNTTVLSLNYLYHTNITPNYTNVVFPLTYPFAFKKFKYENIELNRIYKTCFIGRFNEHKFTSKFIELLDQNEIRIDVACISKNDYPDIKVYKLISTIYNNADIRDVYDTLKKSKYVVIPSTTECICLVVGEALANGCIPIILNKYENKTIFDQFVHGFKCNSEQDMINILIENKNFDMTEITKWANEKFSINRCYKELKCLFGTSSSVNQIEIIIEKEKILPSVLMATKKEFYNASYMIEGREC